MRQHSKLLPLVVVLLALALFGCPKRPEVMQAAPSAPGPVAAEAADRLAAAVGGDGAGACRTRSSFFRLIMRRPGRT